MRSHRAYSDHEIACYVLGLDLHEQTQEIQARLAHDDAAAACALKWEAYFLDIADGLEPSPPPPELLVQIQNSLGMENIPILGDTRVGPNQAAGLPPRQFTENPKTRWFKRPTRKRLGIVVGLSAAAVLLAVLTWAGLRPTSSTIIQQDIQLPGQTQTAL